MLYLKALHQNWGLIGPGDWEQTSWRINQDGKFTIKVSSIPSEFSLQNLRFRVSWIMSR